MRILIQSLGSAGDVHPLLGLGRALVLRGHDVHMIACAAFAGAVVEAGLHFVECGDAAMFERLKDNPDLWHPRKGLAFVMREAVAPSLRPAYASIVERIIPGETVLLASTLGLSALVAAETHGVPIAVAHLAPCNFPSVHHPPQFAGLPLPAWLPDPILRGAFRVIDVVSDRMVCPALNEFRASLGLAPVKRIFTSWTHAADVLLGLFPAWFAAPQPDWPQHLQLTGFPLWDVGDDAVLDPDLAAWFDAGPPPIVFTAGSANIFGAAFYRASIDAARGIGRRAVLVTQNREILPRDLPDDVRHVAYAPFAQLFARSAAVVHHGGIGTTAQGLAAGIPAVVAAMGFDQFDNGARLRELGAGTVLPMSRYTATRAARALRALLHDDAVRRVCETATERLAAADPLEAACTAIEAARG